MRIEILILLSLTLTARAATWPAATVDRADVSNAVNSASNGDTILIPAGTATWTFVKNVSATATLRSRRNDPRNGTHLGQLFLFDTPSGYSSKWASATEWSRISPAGTILAGDILG